MPDKPVLTIDDPEAVALAAEVERLSGRSVTALVVNALRHEAERLRPKGGKFDPAEGERRRQEVRRIQDEVRSWPVVDHRPANELLGYNEDGLFD